MSSKTTIVVPNIAYSGQQRHNKDKKLLEESSLGMISYQIFSCLTSQANGRLLSLLLNPSSSNGGWATGRAPPESPDTHRCVHVGIVTTGSGPYMRPTPLRKFVLSRGRSHGSLLRASSGLSQDGLLAATAPWVMPKLAVHKINGQRQDSAQNHWKQIFLQKVHYSAYPPWWNSRHSKNSLWNTCQIYNQSKAPYN